MLKNSKVFYYINRMDDVNWQVAALSCGASIYLYDGSPLYPEIDITKALVTKQIHYLEWAQNI